MLASILPGLRDLRTPLVTGYLYGLLAWLLWGDADTLKTSNNELISKIRDLSELAGPATTLAAISFSCYLVGSLAVIRNITYESPLTRIAIFFPVDIANRILDRQREIDSGLPRDVRAWTQEQARILVRRGLDLVSLSERTDLPTDFTAILANHRSTIGTSVKPREYTFEQASFVLQSALNSEYLRSAGTLVLRLQITRESLYSDYDRLKSEAELRFSIFLPLFGIIWVAVNEWSYFAIFGLLLPFVLAFQGVLNQREAKSRVDQALVRGVIELPIVQKLTSDLDERDLGAR